MKISEKWVSLTFLFLHPLSLPLTCFPGFLSKMQVESYRCSLQFSVFLFVLKNTNGFIITLLKFFDGFPLLSGSDPDSLGGKSVFHRKWPLFISLASFLTTCHPGLVHFSHSALGFAALSFTSLWMSLSAWTTFPLPPVFICFTCS